MQSQRVPNPVALQFVNGLAAVGVKDGDGSADRCDRHDERRPATT